MVEHYMSNVDVFSGARPVSDGTRRGCPTAEMNAQAFSLIAEGDAAWLSGDVPAILHRPARPFDQFAADHAATLS
jgi:hypothetical protein